MTRYMGCVKPAFRPSQLIAQRLSRGGRRWITVVRAFMSSGKQPVFAALRSGGTTMFRRFLQFVRALFFPRCEVWEINSAELIQVLKRDARSPITLKTNRTVRNLPANAVSLLSSPAEQTSAIASS